MKKLLFVVLIFFISCTQSFSQKRKISRTIPRVVTKEQLAVRVIKNYFKESKNAWNDVKLLKYDKVDTLYILPEESKEFIKTANEKIPSDSSSYYYHLLSKAVAGDKNYDNINRRKNFWNKIRKDNMDMHFYNLDYSIMHYSIYQKGWKMRCRISYNNEEQNIEVQFNPELTNITNILSERYAQIYEKLRHPNSIEEYRDLLKTYNDRGTILE